MPQERNRAMMGFLSTNILQVAALAAEAAATRTRRPRRLPKKPTQKQNNFFNQVLNHRTWTWTSRDSETSPFLCLHAFLPISQPKLRRRRARPRPRSDPRKTFRASAETSGCAFRLRCTHCLQLPQLPHLCGQRRHPHLPWAEQRPPQLRQL